MRARQTAKNSHSVVMHIVLLVVMIATTFAVMLSVMMTFNSCRSAGSEDGTALPGDDTAKITETDTSAAESTAGTENESESNAGAGTEANTETEAETETEGPAGYIYPVTYPESQAGSKSGVTLYAKDFGAVGDGIHDDGPAIQEAVKTAVEQSATLQFEKGKTYLIRKCTNWDRGFRTPFQLKQATNVTIDGQNSLFVSANGLRYFDIYKSENVKLMNCRFTGETTVYLVGEVVSSRGNVVTFSVDREPNQESYNFDLVSGFAIPYSEPSMGRSHRFMKSMTRVGDCLVEVEFHDSNRYKKGERFFLPNPGVGHQTPEIAHISACQGAISLENIQIHEAPSFVMAILRNRAEIYLHNVDYMPAPEDGRDIHMVGWRDGFHCKDNRLPIHWSECDTGILFDDVFNIRSTVGIIEHLKNNRTFTVTNYEYSLQKQHYCMDMEPGDVLDIFDHTNGRYYGCVIIESVTQNEQAETTTVTIRGDMPPERDLKKGLIVANRSTAAPGSTVCNSRFQAGTYRFTRDVRIENCVLENLAMWIMYEGHVEGPLAGNMDFIDCEIRGGRIETDAYNRGTNTFLPGIGHEIKDVGFFGCTITDVDFVKTHTGSQYIIRDTWTKDDLFTEKNRLKWEAILK